MFEFINNIIQYSYNFGSSTFFFLSNILSNVHILCNPFSNVYFNVNSRFYYFFHKNEIKMEILDIEKEIFENKQNINDMYHQIDDTSICIINCLEENKNNVLMTQLLSLLNDFKTKNDLLLEKKKELEGVYKCKVKELLEIIDSQESIFNSFEKELLAYNVHVQSENDILKNKYYESIINIKKTISDINDSFEEKNKRYIDVDGINVILHLIERKGMLEYAHMMYPTYFYKYVGQGINSCFSLKEIFENLSSVANPFFLQNGLFMHNNSMDYVKTLFYLNRTFCLGMTNLSIINNDSSAADLFVHKMHEGLSVSGIDNLPEVLLNILHSKIFESTFLKSIKEENSFVNLEDCSSFVFFEKQGSISSYKDLKIYYDKYFMYSSNDDSNKRYLVSYSYSRFISEFSKDSNVIRE